VIGVMVYQPVSKNRIRFFRFDDFLKSLVVLAVDNRMPVALTCIEGAGL